MSLFHALVDDAGLFPPTALPMTDALARHKADLAEGSPVLTHRFLVAASRLPELREHLDHPVRLGIILDTPDLPPLKDLDVELVEVPGGAAVDLGDLPARQFVEATAAQLPVDLPAGVGLKVRCGGTVAAAFPTAQDLGAFISHCVERGIPFKATAGLHNAVRHFDPALGVDRHGFLNLVLAVCAAVAGEDPVAVLSTTDVGELVRLAHDVPDGVAVRARELLVSYGSCSTKTPVEDLLALGLITERQDGAATANGASVTRTVSAEENV
ncbi:hypothetical protein [Streptosporangium carneum]|uniref:Uncharacterized protein n=1 Tax=Streptosporangium carneum TaxID=47481 RepID=A0A9W6I4U8_9ACTN|nr:hypothetical protein [Streptosporangium carneum]GLK11198.1 hypothetical protein GCM10017600_46040 [Streptosporangium carneum]